MQIGPSLSLLQALGSQPGAPERIRLKPAADVEAGAAQQQASRRIETRRPEAVVASERTAAPEPDRAHAPGNGPRIDIRV